MKYKELSIEERSLIQIGLAEGLSQRAIGKLLNRSHTTVGREIQRNLKVLNIRFVKLKSREILIVFLADLVKSYCPTVSFLH